MAGPFAYYQYSSLGTVGAAANQTITGPGVLVSVTEPDGNLIDAGGNGGVNTRNDTFFVGAQEYRFTGGYTGGAHAGDFRAQTVPGGVISYFSETPSIALGTDVISNNAWGGAGNWSNVDATNLTLTCFLAGTMMRTATGETAIDKLAIGDLVVTADGSLKPVKFIGRQTVALLFADKAQAQPILIKAGALGQNLPARDLYTSPGHAMLVNGALVIAGALVNGSSVVRWDGVPSVFTYYHIELEGHEIVFAEDAATETYCDNVPRDVFDNAAEYKALYPNAMPITQLDLPTVKSARQLPVATARMLDQRVAALGLAASKAA